MVDRVFYMVVRVVPEGCGVVLQHIPPFLLVSKLLYICWDVLGRISWVVLGGCLGIANLMLGCSRSGF